MTMLTALIQALANFFIACGISAGRAPLVALVLLYLLVTILIAAFLFQVLVSRRTTEQTSAGSQSHNKEIT